MAEVRTLHKRDMKSKNNKKTIKLNWFTITKKYWKEQLFFYVLTTLSCLGSFVISTNVAKKIAEAISKGKVEYNLEWKFFGKLLGVWKFNSQAAFITAMMIVIIIACLIVVAHVYYAYWFANKITVAAKKRLTKKLFSLQNSHNKKETLTVLTNNVRTFSYLSIFVPNQIYYALLDTIMTFVAVYQAGKQTDQHTLIWWGIAYYLVILSVVFFFQYWVYKKDQPFQKTLKKETEREDFLVNNRDLIIKKNLTNTSLDSYHLYLNKTHEKVNKRDWIYTLAFVVPAFSLVRATGFVFLPFVKGLDTFIAVDKITGLCDSTKKMIERLKDYPYGLSAQKQINDFLAQPERDDIQKNTLVSEPIESINLKKVSFAYQKDKPILKKMDLQFKKGKVNHLAGENGFGKSTIISLIMGLRQPNQGEIIINNNHKLSELNLIKWREKIAYAEHENLVENGLSTGQKQLADLNRLFADIESKEVFIFDEADNALDEKNKKDFRQQVEKISKKKLVILIGH